MHVNFFNSARSLLPLYAGVVTAALALTVPAAAAQKKTLSPTDVTNIALPQPSPEAAATPTAAKKATPMSLPVMGMISEPTVPTRELAALYQKLVTQSQDVERALEDCRSGRKPWTPALQSFAALLEEIDRWRGNDAAVLLTSTWANTYMRGDSEPPNSKTMLDALTSGQGSEELRSMLSYYALANHGVPVGLAVFQVYEHGVKKPGKTRTLAMAQSNDRTFVIDTHLMPNQKSMSYRDFRQSITAIGFTADDSGFSGLSDRTYFDPDKAYWPLYVVSERSLGKYPDAPLIAEKSALPVAAQNNRRSALSIGPTDTDDYSMAVTKIALQAANARQLSVTNIPSDSRLTPRVPETISAQGAQKQLLVVKSAITGTDIEIKSGAERLLIVGPRLDNAFSLFKP